MRQFRRLNRIRLKTSAQRAVPADFMARLILAHRECPWTGYATASIIHDRGCAIRRGKSCMCMPDVFIAMPDGALVEIDAVGRCKKKTRQ